MIIYVSMYVCLRRLIYRPSMLVKAAEAEAHRLRVEAAAAVKAQAQLRALVASLDGTREQLVVRLKAAMEEIRDAEGKLVEETESRRQAEEDKTTAQEDACRLRGVLEALDGERSRVHNLLDGAEERLVHTEKALQERTNELEDTRRLMSVAEGRLGRTGAALSETETELTRLTAQVTALAEAEAALREECSARGDELHDVAGDLASMTREQQVVNAELVNAADQRDRAHQELREVCGKLVDAEHLAAARQRELDEVVKSYQDLGLEHARIHSALKKTERDLQRHHVTTSTSAGELKTLRQTVARVDSENMQYVADLQAFERQTNALARELQQAEAQLDQMEDERQAMVKELSTAKQVRVETERSREAVMRELAQADASLHMMKSRLSDGSMENEALTHRLHLEQNHVRELETLLASVRTEQHSLAAAQSDLSTRGEVSVARARALEEQNVGLKHQVASLQASRDAADREVEKLQTSIAREHQRQDATVRGIREKEEEQRQLAVRADLAELVGGEQQASNVAISLCYICAKHMRYT
jgi:centrosomal protein CEP135